MDEACSKCHNSVSVPVGYDWEEPYLCWACEKESLNQEIDRLRHENTDLRLQNDTSDYVKEIRHERDELREKLADSELVRENTYKNLLEAEQYRDLGISELSKEKVKNASIFSSKVDKAR